MPAETSWNGCHSLSSNPDGNENMHHSFFVVHLFFCFVWL